MFRKRQVGRTWRAIVACAVAYALALNVILAGAFGARVLAAGGEEPGAFEICLGHNGDSDPGLPAQPINDKLHCVLCVTGAQAPVLPEDAVIAMTTVAATAIILGHDSDGRPPSNSRDPGKPPRGPPLKA